MTDVYNIRRKLNNISFNQVLRISKNAEDYTFNDYLQNNKIHPICGFCTECEKMGVNLSTQEPDKFKLMNISHGSHSLDFLEAMNVQDSATSDWRNDGVLFVMESPSKDYKIYENKEINGFEKRPSKVWYWIHDNMNPSHYPDHFTGSKYGLLIASIITTFKLKNAYLTNLVKCGMNDASGIEYRNFDDYDKTVINTCIDTNFNKELNVLNPNVIFVFGRKAYDIVSLNIKKSNLAINVYLLPHPARAQVGFTNEFYKVLYFNIVAKALFQNKVINESEAISLHRLFLEL